MLDLKPIGTTIILKQEEFKTKSGIILADSSVKGGSCELFEGTVLRVGKDVSSCKPGDKIVFGKNAFSTIVRNKEEYLLIYNRDVCCLVEEKKKG